MDVRQYYQKIREAESKISEGFVVIASRETGDGGRGGVLTEVPKAMAARLIVEGRANLASAEEATEFRRERSEARRIAEEKSATSKIQVTFLTEDEIKTLRNVKRDSR